MTNPALSTIQRVRRHVQTLGQLAPFGLRYLEAQLYRRRSWVVERWQIAESISDAKQIAIFTHYDARGQVPDYVCYYLDQLRDCGYTILFVTNSPFLTAEAWETLRPLCGMILRRRNLGYDFGAYRDALREIPDLGRLDSLILANDSVYGPIQPLRLALERADLNEADIWGINDSYAHRYHLQSYFLIFNRRALLEPQMKGFWDRLLYVRSKSFVIRYYELGLSHTAIKAGLRLKALCPYRKLVTATIDSLEQLPLATPKQRAKLLHGDYLKWLYDTLQSGTPINPSHYFWEGMLTQHSCPFIKRELLTKNPAGIPQLPQWEAVIHRVSHYDSSLIVRHLQETLRNRCV